LYYSYVKVNITFARFVVDILSMLLLLNAYTEHNANTSPAPWANRFLSTEKEQRFGDKSETDLFLKNQKLLIHFCMKKREDVTYMFFGNSKTKQIGWPVGKLDAIWSSSVRFFKQLSQGGVMSSYHNYVATYSGKKRQEAMWIHHFVILQLFHVKFRKLEDITFLHDNHSLLVCNFEDHEVQEFTDMYQYKPEFQYLWLGQRI
jgi:hypothetical protein